MIVNRCYWDLGILSIRSRSMMEICLKCYLELFLIGSMMMMMTPIENLCFGCRLDNYRWYDHRIGQENRLRWLFRFRRSDRLVGLGEV